MPPKPKLGKAGAFRDHGFDPLEVGRDEVLFECFECGKPKLYANRETGLYHCMVCGESGNSPKFLAWVVEDNGCGYLQESDFVDLARARHLPLEAFYGTALGFDGEQWTLPVYNASKYPADVRRWRPGQGFRSTTGCSSSLVNGDALAVCKDKARPVWLVEGEWDVFALEWLLFEAGRNDLVVGVPGAAVFKEDWPTLFVGRKDVRLAYDRDDPGQKGCAKAWRSLLGVDAGLRRVRWDVAAPEGFDAHDWVAHGWNEHRGSFPEGCLGPLEEKLTADPPADVDPDDQGRLMLSKPSLVQERYSTRHPHTVNFVPRAARTAELYRFDVNYYQPVSGPQAKAEATLFLEDAGEKVTDTSVKAVQRATELLPIVSEQGWIGPKRADDKRPPAAECVPVQNGLLHPPSRTLYPATAEYFARGVAACAFAPEVKCPRFHRFKRSLALGRKQERLLQQWFGYTLVADNRFQKFLVLHGAPRAGKGTLARLLLSMHGSSLSGELTMLALEHPHGETNLPGKRLVVFPDERGVWPPRATQILVQVSGGDGITINLKYKDPYEAHLPTRFMVVTNEAAIASDDIAQAIAARALAVRFTKSFQNVMDPDLERRLRAELSGILNWALDGLDDVMANGFVETAESADFVRASREAGSPVLAWLNEKCDLGPEFRCGCTAAFNSWEQWASTNGHRPQGRAQLSTALLTALPGCIAQQTRDTERRQYPGFRLKAGRLKAGRLK